jgi:predicted PurR-regulated permease PerM
LSIGVAIIATAAAIWILTYAKDLLVPLAVALLIGWLIDAVADGIEEWSIFGRSPPGWMALTAALIGVIAIMTGAGAFVANSAEQIIEAAPGYEEKLDLLLLQGAELLGIEGAFDFQQFFDSIDLSGLITGLAGALTGLIGNAFLIFIYVGFILAEERVFDAKMSGFFKSDAAEQEARQVLGVISSSIQSYLRVKTLTSAATGGVSYVILSAFAVDFAVFWAFLIFLLNFIPTIGSIIGAVIPAVLAMVQFGDPLTALLILVLLGVFAQFLIGNFWEPRLMGRSLNLSPLVIILSLSVWGMIWGVAGMFLSVPLTVIAMIACSHFEPTRPFAVLLSADGRAIETLSAEA